MKRKSERIIERETGRRGKKRKEKKRKQEINVGQKSVGLLRKV
jgi:hypothetical protein